LRLATTKGYRLENPGTKRELIVLLPVRVRGRKKTSQQSHRHPILVDYRQQRRHKFLLLLLPESVALPFVIQHVQAGTLPTSASDPIFPTTISSTSAQPKPLPHPHLRPSKSSSNLASNPGPVIRATTMPAGSFSQGHHRAPPEYDLADEENLPSPFLKKNDKNSQAKVAGVVGSMTNLTAIAPSPSTATSTSSISTTSRGKRRPSSGLLLRAVAAANNVERRGTLSSTSTTASPVLDNENSPIESMPVVDAGMTIDNHNGGGIPRPSLASARKASEEARKALLRT